MNHTVAVMGAGIVGVSCALELQRRGAQVTLIDRRAPGQETSYGNAGVIARSSLMPFNHPGLWRALPTLLRNQSAQFRYNPAFLARNAGWALGFLANARRSVFEQTTTALDALIRLSMAEHLRLLDQAGARQRLRENGWLFLYRSAEAFARGQASRNTFEHFGVATEALDPHGLSDLEPHLAPIFPKALWIKDTASVDSPGQVVAAYARLFAERGGNIEQREVTGLERDGSGWRLRDAAGGATAADQVVVALGPWAKDFLGPLGLSVPMAFERGYHMHYGATGGATLNRPIYDTGGAYVLSPMEQGLRLSTGVELTDCDAPPNLTQLTLAEQAATAAFPLGQRLEDTPWLGRRPTLPDSRPVIGAAPRHPGLWLAFGHQHIGFNTGPGTAAVLASLMAGEAPAIDPAPFRPERFIR
ncbi:FAD-dependent oxidoreductase [Xylophilus sp. GW821-FHT01B05]